MKYPAVPVIMYHSVGVVRKEWIWSHLTCPWGLFEQHLRWLKRLGFQTITLQELYEYKKTGTGIPHMAIVLTFDDGYLDNWVFAYPLLKKYNFKGTIFVNPEFVDPRNIVRKNLEDVRNEKALLSNLDTMGFLSWEEMKIMEDEGIMDIQSHSMSHTWYFVSGEIIDFHYPGNNKYPWIFWNTVPERKSFYLTENQETFVPYGTPIYEHGRSLGIKRYFEDKDLTQYLVSYVREQGKSFFDRNDWKDEMFHQVGLYKSKNKIQDRYETDEEQEERFKYELLESKRILEERLRKKVNFLCWAGGAYNDNALRIAKEGGYVSSTLLYGDTKIKNTFGEDPAVINRIGCASAFYWRNRFISYTDPGFFIANIRYFQGTKIYLWIMRLYKIKYLVKFIIRRLLKGEESL